MVNHIVQLMERAKKCRRTDRCPLNFRYEVILVASTRDATTYGAKAEFRGNVNSQRLDPFADIKRSEFPCSDDRC